MNHFSRIALLPVLFMVGCASSTTKTAAPDTAKAATADAHAKSVVAAEGDKTKTPDAGSSVTCKSAKETRTLTNKPVGKGCEVVYDRGGEKTVAASAKNDPTHCGKVVDRIKGNLEKSGFKCEKQSN